MQDIHVQTNYGETSLTMDNVPVEMDEDDEATTDTALKETIEDYV